MKNFFYHLSLLESRITAHFSQEKYLHPERFSYPHEFAYLSFSQPHDDGLFLGMDPFDRILQITATPKRQSLDHGIDLIPLLQQSVQRTFEKSRSADGFIAPLSTSYRPVGMAGGKASASRSPRLSAKLHKARESTLSCPNGMSHKVVKWKGKDFCTVDKKVLEQSMGLAL